jgi:class 3 adenylate cyclase/putative methionine-R-sulfoxide reductase with GAF domain
MRTKSAVQIADAATDPGYVERRPEMVAAVELGGVRTMLGVPMLKENDLVGVFAVNRQEVRPFTDRQIAPVTNFAAQAVIAIENARLLNELRQRTTDLTEALEQQTATSEVLRIISSSPSELDPLFQTMLTNAAHLCQANFGTLTLNERDTFRVVALYNVPEAFAELRRRQPTVRFSPKHPLAQQIATKRVLHIADVKTETAYVEGDPSFVRFVDLAGPRTLLNVPMLKDNEVIGTIGIYRKEVRPFTDKQIELLQNFAAQAVIAIENARLLNELRQRTSDLTERTTDLTEALEQQTATSEVLQVISSSPGDLQPVFATMLANMVRVCNATLGSVYRFDGDAFRFIAQHNTLPAHAERIRYSPFRPGPKHYFARMIATKSVDQVADLAAEQGYLERRPEYVTAVELGRTRTALFVPMLKENKLIGVFAVARQEVRPFTDKQIELVKNFAAQAVIAIENARLLKELRERTEQVEAQSQELVKLNQQLEQRVADQVGEIERMSRLRRFLPPQVADLIVASGSEKQLESHRREITALFCDLRGFTGFSESADPEDVMTLLREYHEAIGESIIKYSGTLERYAGDGVMVVFNDPVPVENPALQAVLMALEMRDAIAALTDTWRRWGHDIGFGIGIAHGFATLGTIGFEGRFDYAAIGTVSNVASRLCDEAKPGQILISPRVLTKVENTVKVEPIGEFELKGIRRPLAAYNVVGAVSSHM